MRYALLLTKREIVALNRALSLPEVQRELAGKVDMYKLQDKVLFAFSATCTADDALRIGCDDLHGTTPLELSDATIARLESATVEDVPA